MKIAELEVNNTVTITLVVRSATSRLTKAGKQYLAVELFDGKDTINGNYWDWPGVNIPEKNVVVDVDAQVTEWQGTKQLNIKRMVSNNTTPASAFAPSSGVDVHKVYSDAYALLSDVKDTFLRSLALGLMDELQHLWLEVPGAKGVHHAYLAGTLIHSYSVACIAKNIAKAVEGANEDLCVVGALLHDVGKLFSYKLNAASIDMTDDGILYNHLFIGAELVGNYAEENLLTPLDNTNTDKLAMLRHIILSHHGKQEYEAVVIPMSLEARIVYHADSIDADAEQIRVASSKVGKSKWTDKIWTLDSRAHLSTHYVAETMKSDVVDEE